MSEMPVFCPASIPSLIVSLRSVSQNRYLVAGGTDLVIHDHEHKGTPGAVIVLGSVPEMQRIEQHRDYLKIGASVRFCDLESFDFPPALLSIRDAAGEIGSVQIRNAGTIGGNIANTSPSADFSSVLNCLNAKALIIKSDGTSRELSIDKLILGAGKTALSYDEVILAFTIPLNGDHKGVSVYRKLGYRRKVSVTRIGLAVSCEVDLNNRSISNANVWLTAVAPKAVPCPKAADFLNQSTIDSINRDEFAKILADFVTVSSPRVYKHTAVKGLAFDTAEVLESRFAAMNKN